MFWGISLLTRQSTRLASSLDWRGRCFRRICLFVGLLLFVCATTNAQTDATWTGAGDGVSWNDPINWDIGVVPINAGLDTYSVNISGGVSVTFDVDGSSEVTDFSLADGSTLNLGSGRTLNVLEEASIAGIIHANWGHFSASMAGGAQLSGNKASLDVSNVGTIEIAGQSYSSTGLWYAAFGARTNTYDLFTSSGAGSVLDLSSLQSINAGFNDNDGDDTNVQRIRAWDGGRIDLSGLRTITAPAQEWNDRLEFHVVSGSEIDLSSLQSITSAGSGTTRFYLSNVVQALPELVTADRTVFYLNQAGGPGHVTADKLQTLTNSDIDTQANVSLNFPELTTMTSVELNLSDHASLVAENLIQFDGIRSSVTLTPLRAFTTGGLVHVNNAQFHARDGVTWGVSSGDFVADSYSSTGLWYAAFGARTNTYDLFTSSGAGSVLDLSSLQSIHAGFNDNDGDDTNVQRIRAWDGARIDLSGLQTITAPAQEWDDRLEFHVDGGSEIDLSGLQSITSAGSGTTRFYVTNTTETFPALVGASGSVFYLNRDAGPGHVAAPELQSAVSSELYFRSGSTFSAPKLQTWNGGRIDLADGVSLTFPDLTQLSVDLNMVDNASFVATQLIQFDGTQSSVELTPLRTFTTGGLLHVNNGQFHARDGVVWGVSSGDFAADSYSSTSLWYAAHNPRTNTYDLFTSSGAGSVLDLSSLQSIHAGFNDNDNDDTNVHRIRAWDGGRIDLSGLQTITAPAQEWDDRLEFHVESGSEIDLSSLQTITSAGSGTTRFYVSNTTQALPSLVSANRTVFYLDREGGPGQIVAPNLQTLTTSDIHTQANGTLELPSLTTMTSVGLSLSDHASLVAENLIQFDGTRSSVTLTPLRTFTTGGLVHVNNAQFHARDGVTWGVSSGDFVADSYSSTGLWHSAFGARTNTYDLFTSSGAGSVLDLSSIQSINAGFNDNDGDDTNVQRIRAWEGGRIDLSGLQTIIAPAQEWDDRLEFHVDGGSEIDLSGLQSITSAGSGRTQFEIGTEGRLALGNVAATKNVVFNVNDVSSELRTEGTLYLSSSAQLNVVAGAKVSIGGDFLFQHTDESKLGIDEASMHLDGAGMQFLEVGGEDLGAGGATSGNFGIGQLVIGQEGAPTNVHLLDLLDNGNRGAGGQFEVLYLFGLGGQDGLDIRTNSILVLDNIQAYAYLDGQMVNLNGLFGDEVLGVPIGEGTVALVGTDPADFNFDGAVDGADGQVWQSGFGATGGVTAWNGDADQDGDVDGGDFLAWQRSFGNSGGEVASQAAVPEPASCTLLLTLAVALGIASRPKTVARSASKGHDQTTEIS